MSTNAQTLELNVRLNYNQVFKGLVFFAILRSTDPEKQKALDKLQELRVQVIEQLDIITGKAKP